MPGPDDSQPEADAKPETEAPAESPSARTESPSARTESPSARTESPSARTRAAAAAPAGAVEEAPADPLAAAEERARKAEAERKDAHDRMLRVAADFENFKKRSRKDAEDADLRGRRTALTAVLPVLDNLDRGLDAANASGDGGGGAIAEGVRLVMKQFMQILEKLEVRPLVAIGQPFDPTVHEAIQQIETADAAPGTVVRELQKGYGMAGKLLRPAMVAVAKAPAPPPEPEAHASEATAAGDAAPVEVEVDVGAETPGSHGPNGEAPPEAS